MRHAFRIAPTRSLGLMISRKFIPKTTRIHFCPRHGTLLSLQNSIPNLTLFRGLHDSISQVPLSNHETPTPAVITDIHQPVSVMETSLPNIEEDNDPSDEIDSFSSERSAIETLKWMERMRYTLVRHEIVSLLYKFLGYPQALTPNVPQITLTRREFVTKIMQVKERRRKIASFILDDLGFNFPYEDLLKLMEIPSHLEDRDILTSSTFADAIQTVNFYKQFKDPEFPEQPEVWSLLEKAVCMMAGMKRLPRRDGDLEPAVATKLFKDMIEFAYSSNESYQGFMGAAVGNLEKTKREEWLHRHLNPENLRLSFQITKEVERLVEAGEIDAMDLSEARIKKAILDLAKDGQITLVINKDDESFPKSRSIKIPREAKESDSRNKPAAKPKDPSRKVDVPEYLLKQYWKNNEAASNKKS